MFKTLDLRFSRAQQGSGEDNQHNEEARHDPRKDILQRICLLDHSGLPLKWKRKKTTVFYTLFSADASFTLAAVLTIQVNGNKLIISA